MGGLMYFILIGAGAVLVAAVIPGMKDGLSWWMFFIGIVLVAEGISYRARSEAEKKCNELKNELQEELDELKDDFRGKTVEELYDEQELDHNNDPL